MKRIFEQLCRPLTSSGFDAQAGRTGCWLVSGLVLVLGLLGLSRLDLTEVELFLGILLLLNISLMGVLIGLVLPIAARIDEEDSLRPQKSRIE